MDNYEKIKIPSDLRDRWLEALRSGEYRQGTGTLCDTSWMFAEAPRYCCLGVLQMVADGEVQMFRGSPRGLPTVGWMKEHGIEHAVSFGHLQDDELTSIVVDERNPYHLPVRTTLSFLNDHGGYNFHKIADIIERDSEGV